MYLTARFINDWLRVFKKSVTVIEIIKPEYVFEEDDILFLSGSKQGVMNLTEWIVENS